MDPPLAHGLEKFHSWYFLKIRIAVFLVPFLKGLRECPSNTTRVWTEFRVGAIAWMLSSNQSAEIQPGGISNTHCQKFSRQLCGILHDEVCPLQKYPHRRKPSGQRSFWNINSGSQADDRLTSKTIDHLSVGDPFIEQKSFISKMSLTAVSKHNKQGRALFANATTAL